MRARVAAFVIGSLMLARLLGACAKDSFGTVPSGDAGGPSEAGAQGDSGGDGGPVCDPSVDFRTDGKNCGRCGHDCLGGQCLDRVCAPVTVLTEDSLASLTVDATSIYYTRYASDGGVYRLDKSAPIGTKGTQIVPQGGAWWAVIRGNALVWSNWGGVSDTGGIYRYPLPGGPTGARLPSGSPRKIVVDPTGIFLIDNYERAVSSTNDTGTITTLRDNLGSVQDLVTDDHYAYFTDYSTTYILSVWKAGGKPAANALDGLMRPDALAIYDGYLYFTQHGAGLDSGAFCDGDGGVYRAALSATGTLGAVEPVALHESCATGLVVDATGIYWVNVLDNAQGTLKHLSKPRGAVETWASGLNRPFFVLRDGSAIYWISSDGMLGRIALP